MRILIIGSKETLQHDPEYYDKYVTFVRVTTPGKPAAVDFMLFDDLYLAVGPGEFTARSLSLERELSDYQVILVRGRYFKYYIDILKALSVYAGLHGITFINDHTSYRSGSKLDQAVTFYTEKAQAPFTVVVTSGLIEHEALPSGISFPCIMKSTFGAHGSNNHVAQSWQDIRTIQAASPKVRFILQQFIPNEGDYRLLIVGQGMAVIKRVARPGSHLNNTSQGGTATLMPLTELPAHVLGDARRLAKRLQLVTAGVDVLQDSTTGAYYVLEVNSQPQLVTGAFLDTKLELFQQYLRTLDQSSGSTRSH